MKTFFKSMQYGIKIFFVEIQPLIQLFASMLIPMIIVKIVGYFFTISNETQFILSFIGIFVGLAILVNYNHFKDAEEYSKENNVSFEDAWEMTGLRSEEF